MRMFTASGLEGSTLCFRKFLAAIDTYHADVGVLLGDLTGREIVSVVKKGESNWEVPIDGKVHELDSRAALGEVIASIEDRGDYWIEQSSEEFENTRGNPMLVDILFKSLIRERIEQWLTLADERLASDGRQVFIAPGCGDWTIIDGLLEKGGSIVPCDNRVVDVDGYQMVTSSSSGPTDWELVREIDDRELHKYLLDLCSGIGDPEMAIFNLQADSRAAQRIIKRFQPLVRFLGTVQGGSGGARKTGRTVELSPRSRVVEDAAAALHGVLAMFEGGEVKDYVFTEA